MKHCQLTPGRISAYEKHLRREERAPATVTKYLRAVRELAAFLDGRPVTKENLLEWKERLLSAGLSPATVNGRLSALSGLLRFLGREDCRVKFLRLQRRTFRERELTRMEYLRLLETARETGRERLALLMEAICSTGIRVSEVRFLTVEAAEQGRAGVEKAKVFPHNLRHLFAATFYRVCRDIVKLADLLGHSSINTTRTYLLTSGQEHIRCLERLRLIC